MHTKNNWIMFIFLISSFASSRLGVVKLVDGLDQPVAVISRTTGMEFLYIVEQDGVVRLGINGNLQNISFLDISPQVHQPLYPGDEQGFLGIAFHPKFEINGFLFVNYVNRDGFTIISRFISKDNIADPNTERIIFKIKQPYSNHNGGHLTFGPDGYLYIGLGDGGSAGDPENRAQDLDSFFGKMLRINIDDMDDQPYLIPKDNPFINRENCKPEIWAYGLRNPWRYSFDRITGDLFIGDVGQNDWEEVDFQISTSLGGINYGWNIMEGKHCYLEDDCDNSSLTHPIYEYPNNANYLKTLIGINQKDPDGCSITGGFVYQGENIPDLYGKYIFGDYCTGKVWSFRYTDEKLTEFENHTKEIMASMKKNSFYLSSFGQKQNGELLLIDYSGIIYELVNY